MGFDAGAAIAPLTFDLTAFDGPAGVIPEPTFAQIRAYQRWEADAIGARNVEGAYKALTEEDALQLDLAAYEALATLCCDTPAVADLSRLPARVFRAFWAWLVGELMDPTGSSSVTRLSPAAATNGASAS
jgi:hypothetical protein